MPAPFNSLEPNDFLITSLKELLPSEWKLLLLIADDLSNEEVIEIMFISPKSVETYLTRIREKLQLKGKGEIFRFARKNKEALRTFHARLYHI